MLGTMIREAREARSWTQEQLAAQVGVSRVQISRIETGESGADVETLDAIATTLGLDHGEVLKAAAHRKPADAEPEAV